MLPFQARVDLGAIAMKVCSVFPKAPELLYITIRLFSVISRMLIGRSYPSAEVESVYSTAPQSTDKGDHWKIRRLKEAGHMLIYSDLIIRPNIEKNMIWESIIRKNKKNLR